MHLIYPRNESNDSPAVSGDSEAAGAPATENKVAYPEGRRSVSQLGDADFARLGERLFEYQESILPEGEKWRDLSEGDRGFWIDSALRVVWELENILGQPHNRDA